MRENQKTVTKNHSILTLLFLILPWQLYALEPQSIDLKLDQENGYISSLGLNNPLTHDRFNMLLVAYDNPSGGRAGRKYGLVNGRRRAGQSSRSDIMMVISFDRANRQIEIFSLNRDFVPKPSCYSRAVDGYNYSGRNRQSVGGASKINAAGILYGRKLMINCVKSLLGEFVTKNSFGDDYELSGGLFPIHTLFEVKRGHNADESVVGDLVGSLLGDVLRSVSMIQTYWDGIGTLTSIGGRYKVIFNGLKRRDGYPAGSYQRAFNNAKFIADAFGWVGPGVQASSATNFDFLDQKMFQGVDNIFSSTMSLSDLNRHLTFFTPPLEGNSGAISGDDHMLRYGAFVPPPAFLESNPSSLIVPDGKKGTPNRGSKNPFSPQDPVSPVRVIQIGSNLNSYGVYQNGILNLENANDKFTRKLRVRPVFQLPKETVQMCPECQVRPGLSPKGRWGVEVFKSDQVTQPY